MFQIDRIRYFIEISRSGSFTKAARNLKVSKSVVSEHLSRLEEELGVPLIIRTTRKLALTPQGGQFLSRCEQILEAADSAAHELRGEESKFQGALRIAASIDYSTLVLGPLLIRFQKRHPGLRVDLTVSDEELDFIDSRIDLAVRDGGPGKSGGKAILIGRFDQLLVASRSLAKRERITHPSELKSCSWVENTALDSPLSWHFRGIRNERCTVTVRSDLSTNATSTALSLVRADGGYSVLPDYLVREDLESGRLIHTLPEWRLPDCGIYLVRPPGKYESRTISALIQYLRTEIPTLSR